MFFNYVLVIGMFIFSQLTLGLTPPPPPNPLLTMSPAQARPTASLPFSSFYGTNAHKYICNIHLFYTILLSTLLKSRD